MSILDTLPSALKGSALERSIEAVEAVYSRIDRDQRAFLGTAESLGRPLRCPKGCGACCRGFVPDILPVEATYAAAWIVANEPELGRRIAARADQGQPPVPPCPFLDRSEIGDSCSIYPGRPLVCRLFAAAAVRDKAGLVAFRPCSRMPLAGYPPPGEGRPTLVGPELIEAFGSAPPIMADYGAELHALVPAETGRASSIVDALPSALARVGLALSLAEREPDRTYSPHDDSRE